MYISNYTAVLVLVTICNLRNGISIMHARHTQGVPLRGQFVKTQPCERL